MKESHFEAILGAGLIIIGLTVFWINPLLSPIPAWGGGWLLGRAIAKIVHGE